MIEGTAPELEVPPKVLLSDDLVFGQLFCSAFEENLPLKEQISSVGDAQRLIDIVVGDKYPDVLMSKLSDDRLDVLDSDGVYSREGLIKHDELRVDS